MTSKTWEAMSEAERDVERGNLRWVIAEIRATGQVTSHIDRLAVNLADACLMNDRIELGLAVVLLAGADRTGVSDIALGSAKLAMNAAQAFNLPRKRNPSRN